MHSNLMKGAWKLSGLKQNSVTQNAAINVIAAPGQGCAARVNPLGTDEARALATGAVRYMATVTEEGAAAAAGVAHGKVFREAVGRAKG